MKPWLKRLVRLVAVSGLSLTAVLAFIILSDRGKVMLPVTKTPAFAHDGMADFPSSLRADGHLLLNAEGDVVRLRGLMPVDPAVLHGQNRFNRRFFGRLAATGANVIRLPVHPHHWQSDPDYLWRYLDRAAAWAGELGMYLIIDWHSIGNVRTGAAPLLPELYSHDWQTTVDFWTAVSRHFRQAPHVLFEIFNEPQGIDATEWQAAATELVRLIRAQGAAQIVVVGGVEYARDLHWTLANPVPDDNIAYAAHIYPLHKPLGWPSYFGRAAEKYPVLISEWGFMDGAASAEQGFLLAGTAATYGEPLLAYLDERGIGWVACWYDETWEPPLLANGGLTRFGEFVLARLGE